jgi:hypothetical protein
MNMHEHLCKCHNESPLQLIYANLKITIIKYNSPQKRMKCRIKSFLEGQRQENHKFKGSLATN